MSTYAFDPILNRKARAFRLFRLHAGYADDKIEGEILVRRLGSTLGSQAESDDPEPESYDALSYYWGARDPEKDPSIRIRKQSKTLKIRVTQNLYAALKAMRDQRHDKYLWIDSLCIDQENSLEKTFQISYMSMIYNRAESVCVWLGDEDGSSDTAFAFIRKCLDAEEFDHMVQSPTASTSWNALWSLMKRPWFSRRWIVQEIALARTATLQCGSELITWDDFSEVVSQLSEKQEKLRDLFIKSPDFKHHPDHLGDISELGAIRLVEATDELFHRSSDGKILKTSSLEEVICMISVFETTDPHDVIYAILSLADDAHAAQAFIESENPAFGPTSPVSAHDPQNRHSMDVALYPDTQGNISNPNVTISPSHEGSSPGIQVRQVNGDVETLLATNGSHESLHPDADRASADSSRVQSPSRERSNRSHPMVAGLVATNSGSLGLTIPRTARKRSLSDASATPEERTQAALDMLKDRLKKRRFRLDYNKSIFDICQELLLFTTRRSRSLDILCRPWAPYDPKDKEFPSWICPMHRVAFAANYVGVYRRVNPDPLLGKSPAHSSAYKAAPSTTIATHEFHGRTLLVRGFWIEKIERRNIMRSATSGTIPADWKTTGGWDGVSLPPEAFWRTLVGDRTTRGRRAPSYWRRACLSTFRQGSRNHDLETSDAVMHDLPSSTREYVQRLRSVVWNRRLVRMNNTVIPLTFSLVPEATEAGDLICIIYGCNVPVVLRQIPDTSPPKYSLVGECYVHGAMDGEAMRLRARIIEDSKKKHLNEDFDQSFGLV